MPPAETARRCTGCEEERDEKVQEGNVHNVKRKNKSDPTEMLKSSGPHEFIKIFLTCIFLFLVQQNNKLSIHSNMQTETLRCILFTTPALALAFLPLSIVENNSKQCIVGFSKGTPLFPVYKELFQTWVFVTVRKKNLQNIV